MMFLTEISSAQFRDVYKQKPKVKRKIIDLLDRFVESGYAVAKVNTHAEEYKSPTSAYTGIKNAINRERKGNQINACMRRGEIYLYRVDMVKDLD